MGDDVNDGPKDNGPGGSLVEGDVLVERNDVVQGRLTQQGDEVPAYREQDKGNVDVENEGSSPSGGWEKFGETYFRVSDRKRRTEPVSEHSPGVVVIIIQLIVNESQGKDKEVEEYPDEEKQTTATLVDHPDIPPVNETLGLVWPAWSRTCGVSPLKRLQTPPLRLVSLEVAGLGGSVGIALLEIRMFVQIGDLPAVGEIEARRSFQQAQVRGHRKLRNMASCAWVGRQLEVGGSATVSKAKGGKEIKQRTGLRWFKGRKGEDEGKNGGEGERTCEWNRRGRSG